MADGHEVSLRRPAPWNDPLWRGVFWQILTLGLIVWLAWLAVDNAIVNMRARNIPTDFSFWDQPASFDVNQTLVPFSSNGSSNGQAFLVGLLNTLLAAAVGIVLTTIVGFTVGIARLSNNWIVARLAGAYVEIIRNTPLLLQLLFWYNAVLKPLPGPRESFAFPGDIFLNNRGLVMPEPQIGPGFDWVVGAIVVALLLSVVFAIWARRQQAVTGARYRTWPLLIGLLIVLVGGAAALQGAPVTFVAPVLRGFNFAGGVRVIPEFVALVLGLSLYIAAFIAEIVRAGVSAVPRGQSEAGRRLD